MPFRNLMNLFERGRTRPITPQEILDRIGPIIVTSKVLVELN